jgi:integrase
VRLKALKEIRKENRCPSTEQKEEKLRIAEKMQADSDALTVTGLVELYLTQYIEDRVVNGKAITGARKKKGQSETRRTIYGDVVRVLGNKPAHKITRKDVVNLIMDIVGRGANVQAGNVLRELTAAYEYAIGLEKFDDEFANPALLAKSSLRQAKVKLTANRGKRVLSDQELTKLLQWLPGSVFTPTQKNILRFTLWTACRTGEVCTAEWNDIDLEAGTWHLRATKTDVERHVQLPVQAIAFLKQLRLTTGDYLFPSKKTGLPIQQKSITEQAWHLRVSGRMVDVDH